MSTRVALAIASFVVLIVHGIVFYQQFFNRWEKHQTAYFEQARSLAATDPERRALDERTPRIEQTIVTQFGESRVDRCATCHIASDDPRFQGHAEPLRTHPYSEALGDVQRNGRWERRHKFTDFGCTICHDGQGRGLETFYAHGEDVFWPDPMLGYVTQADWHSEFKARLTGKEYMQANCAQCHTEENFAGTPLVQKGRQLFFQKACYGCHRIEGLSNGTLGPDLSDVGKKFKINYLWEHTVNPRTFQPTSFMPKFDLTDDEIKALTIFLKSRRGINFAETSLGQYRARLQQTSATAGSKQKTGQEAPPSPARGEQLIAERSCTACHKLGERDGHIAPDLSYEGLLRDDNWLVAHFKEPKSRVPDSIMPVFGFGEADFRSIASYLETRTTPPAYKTPEEIYKNLPQPNSITEDRRRYCRFEDRDKTQLFCRGLHLQQPHDFLDRTANVDRQSLQVELSRFDFREIQDVVDQGEQHFSAGADGFHIIPLFCGEVRTRQQVGEAEHSSHRCADLVAHIRQQHALGAVRGFGLELCLSQCFFIPPPRATLSQHRSGLGGQDLNLASPFRTNVAFGKQQEFSLGHPFHGHGQNEAG